jgi:hypothetical protein
VLGSIPSTIKRRRRRKRRQIANMREKAAIPTPRTKRKEGPGMVAHA